MDRKFLMVAGAFLCLPVVGFLVLGPVGFLTISAFLLFFFLPAFAVLGNFSMPFEEKLLFSVGISLGVFPILVWLLNKAVPSFRLSAIIVAALLIAGGFGFRFLRRK